MHFPSTAANECSLRRPDSWGMELIQNPPSILANWSKICPGKNVARLTGLDEKKKKSGAEVVSATKVIINVCALP